MPTIQQLLWRQSRLRRGGVKSQTISNSSNIILAPQGDRPLPAPREAGPLGSSLRRRRPRPVGGVAPPRPQLFSFLTFLFSFLFPFVCVFFAPMRDCRTVWLSVARQCGAAELRSVAWFYLFVVCCVFFVPSGCLSFLFRFYRRVIAELYN